MSDGAKDEIEIEMLKEVEAALPATKVSGSPEELEEDVDAKDLVGIENVALFDKTACQRSVLFLNRRHGWN
ncbi:hypothetical protein Moror_12675 [Moniliophthora roreri MCA 2997]|uniref:Uncharacterized protein n=2 Tax=Moniliophthora roreri TaxID=221103 RepID=V2YUY2_MONRO|nr:hypothetical protein Moror_12675 [Moniliophthora roreri MCA 2997]